MRLIKDHEARSWFCVELDHDPTIKAYCNAYLSMKKPVSVEVWASSTDTAPRLVTEQVIWVGLDWVTAQPELQHVIARHLLCS